MFDFTPVGLVVALVGVAFVVASFVLTDAIGPNLVWRIGRIAAAIRKAAIAGCAAALELRGDEDASAASSSLATSSTASLSAPLSLLLADEDVDAVFAQLRVPVVSCLADDEPDTRRWAVVVLATLFARLRVPLGGDIVRAVVPPLLARLDDADDDVRLRACAAIPAAVRACTIADAKGAPVEHSADALLIHADDPDERVRDQACRALQSLVPIDPQYLHRAALQHRLRHRSPEVCDDIVARARSLLDADQDAGDGVDADVGADSNTDAP
jgi:dynein assembly factor 5